MKTGVLGKFIKGAEGSVAVMAALGMMAFLGMASLAVDLGQLYTVRNEIQNSADAAALAAAGNLIKDQGGEAVRDSAAATEAARTVAQRQSELLGLPAVPVEDRTDLTILFGEWNLNASPATAWTEIGTSCGSYSNANAVQVTLRRASGLTYGPVANLFASILSFSTSNVQATAIAYLGYTTSAGTGTVEVPVAVPSSVLTAANAQDRPWFARLFCSEAAASAPTTVTFKDLGSDTFYQNNLGKPQFDLAKAYMFIVNQSDSVPGTVVNNLKKNYTSGTPVRPIERGTRLYPLSEYQWASNIKTIFQTFKSAYDANKGKYDEKRKYQNPAGKWRVYVPVYTDNNPVAQGMFEKLMHLGRLFAPGVPQAHACFKFWSQSYPGGNVPIYTSGFANVDITDVTYVSTCDDCSPYAPAESNNVYYSSAVDCMVNNPNSCRNVNSVTVEIPVDSSTVSPPGSFSGGSSNAGTYGGPGALATIPRLVK